MKYMALNERVYLVGESMKKCSILFVLSLLASMLCAPESPPGGDHDQDPIPATQPPLRRSNDVTPPGFDDGSGIEDESEDDSE